ncbi:uncharacterized protein LOC108915233, partial [Anoplophora glabripennis]|uniref:uncharacterized protein LOC108915233 n=1 Tax=Anoplophora glabripennis TaxID=217634 RepID=UPI0008749BC0
MLQENPMLSEIQKFQYLRSTLKGEALQVIQALQCTGDNYQKAWVLLEKRYEKRRLIINTHVKELFELPNIYKENHITIRKFIDSTRNHIASLETLKEPVASWDTLIIYLLNSKLDSRTSKDWEEKLNNRPANKTNEMPTLEKYLEFLESRCQTLQMIDKNVKYNRSDKKVVLATTTEQNKTPQWTCAYCKNGHAIYACREFINLSVNNRTEEVKRLNLYLNCLKFGHMVQHCRSIACKKCNRKHHSLLHRDYNTTTVSQVDDQQANTSSTSSTESNTHTHQNNTVSAHCAHKELGTGSQYHFITQELHKKLKLGTQHISLPVTGINETSTNITKGTSIKFKSCYNNSSFKLNCLIVPRLTSKLPQYKIDKVNLNLPVNIQLADSKFNIPGSIDVLIGADLFWELLCPNKIKLQKGQPILQETQLGWIISGPVNNPNSNPRSTCHLSVNDNLEIQIERFWKTEELTERERFSPEEIQCEEYFKTTTKRDNEGRYIVSLPKNDSVLLGDSLQTAIRRLQLLEKRLEKNQELKTKYHHFMNEYQAMGHMSEIKNKVEGDKVFYLPHHPVVRDHSVTTKVRMVFDGSAKTTSGSSLNDLLLVGPTIQPDLIHIILRFRTHQYVLTADIAMMYRQINIHDSDKNLQRICWRKDSNDEIKIFTLNTVTYGTSSAPFLATRCLAQLAEDEGENYPLAKQALKNDFYMDDLLTGSSTKEQTLRLRQELMKLLDKGKLPLRKWRSDDSTMLEDLQQGKYESLMVLNKEEPIKTLGLLWNSQDDTIQYSLSLKDPLGLIGPVVTSSKLIMQQLWKLNLSWDEPIPDSLRKLWLEFYNELRHLQDIKLPRNVNPNNAQLTFDIHGFSDASEKAFGAAIYAVSSDKKGNMHSYLICSKSRISPLKTLSIPRLELNGALLLCKLTSIVKKALKEKIRNTYHWTDSTIVLTWIKTPPHLLKTFISNRVAEIQRLSPDIPWYHVPSKQNPADVLSRGTTANNLITNQLWWLGPAYLTSSCDWPNQSLDNVEETLLELKSNPKFTLIATHNEELDTILHRFSSFQKLKRIIAYCRRFIYNTKTKENRNLGPLTVEELKE